MILDWLERRRLVRKGLACDKTRLSHSDDTLQTWAESSWKVRFALLSFFLVLLHIGVAVGHGDLNARAKSSRIRLLAFIVFHFGSDADRARRTGNLEAPTPGWCSSSSVSWFNLAVYQGALSPGHPERLVVAARSDASMSQFYFLCPCTFAPFLITLAARPAGGTFRGGAGQHAGVTAHRPELHFSADQPAFRIHGGLFLAECPQARRPDQGGRRRWLP